MTIIYIITGWLLLNVAFVAIRWNATREKPRSLNLRASS